MVQKKPKDYWKSLQQRDDGTIALPVAGDEFVEVPQDERRGVSRRDFLAAAGFTFGSMALTGCTRAPVEKAIPYLVQPEAIIPGRATYYASTCGACSAGCGILAKNRDGRTIKLEGNPDHPISRGGLCAIGQASVLGLYDSNRLRNSLHKNAPSTWAESDSQIAARLDVIRSNKGAVRVLTGPITSPTARRAVDSFVKTFPDAQHITYDVLSSAAIVQAHERTHERRVLPRYRFDKAEVIVSFDADFLGTWISPVAFAMDWSAGRRADAAPDQFSYHAQFEGRVSVTGAKADRRVRVAPGEAGVVMSHLASRLAQRAGEALDTTGLAPCPIDSHVLDDVANRLWHARGKSLVVCGSQSADEQVLCNFLNHLLGNYGQSLDLEDSADRICHDDEAVQSLIQELASGSVAALFVHGVNPVYDLPNGAAVENAISKAHMFVSLADRVDETSKLATFVCPDHHFLEAWGDHDVGDGSISFFQPTMRPLHDTRSMLESLSIWSGKLRLAQDLVRETTQGRVLWDEAIHNGFAKATSVAVATASFRSGSVKAVLGIEQVPADKLTLVLYPKVSMLDGRGASNPWLQEMPDPISKVVWDNYASLSEATAARLNVGAGDVVRIGLSEADGAANALELPVLIQPGQHDQVVAIALGYGKEESARFAKLGPQWIERKELLGENGLVGTSAAGLLSYRDGTLRLSGASVTVSATRRKHQLACTQDYHNIEVPESLTVLGMDRRRPMVQETTLAGYKRDGKLPQHGHGTHHPDLGELWADDHKYEGHHWGMAVDLTACTGCSACVVACQIENNVPVVGRDEVQRKRIMHWLRIDRYYCDNDGDVDVLHQPMMCQHCDHAPCETVCPVLATVHGEEGLNQQAYNRCVGTRYCANNCPYKVRRFNWFEYARDDTLANQALNPDVTVRSRGVMEKCSFCVQRIEAARLESKQQGRSIADGDIQPACQQSCPARAIVFGDMNDPESAVSKLMARGRHYRLLEETNVRPSVGYLGLVRNRDENKDQSHHG